MKFDGKFSTVFVFLSTNSLPINQKLLQIILTSSETVYTNLLEYVYKKTAII